MPTRFRLHIMDRIMSLRWHCEDKLKQEPDSEVWKRIFELTIRRAQLNDNENTSVEEAEQFIDDLRRLAHIDDQHITGALVLAEKWLDGLKGGEGVNPLPKFKKCWADPQNGRYALSRFDDFYTIIYVSDDGMLLDLTIEDDEIFEAVIDKMLEAGVPVFDEPSDEEEFARHWLEKQSSDKSSDDAP